MILGSHNTMSYLPPKHWWLRPFNFMARCQSKSIKEQYDLGVRLFDIRVGYDKHGKPHFRHGLMQYKGSVEPVMIFLNEKTDCMVRIILEQSYNAAHDMAFILDCRRWENKYPSIRFVCGVRKKDWEPLTTFISIENEIKHEYASMQGGKIDDIFPWLYAKRNNKKNIERYKGKETIVMMDFV